MTWLWILIGILALVVCVWLVLIAPARRPKAIKDFIRPYAHRGLWGGEIPENSLAAFALAAEKGFAIELDVQLSADGEVMVFHDYTLDRMCGVEGKLSERTAAELADLRLHATEERIPTLKQVLSVVAGRVPLLVELKGESTQNSVCAPVAQILDTYAGAYCVESFNPILLGWWKKNRPQVVRGLLVTDLLRSKREGSKVQNIALTLRLTNLLCRPQFLAWDLKWKHRLADVLLLKVFRTASFCFTAQDHATYQRMLSEGTAPIFDSIDELK